MSKRQHLPAVTDAAREAGKRLAVFTNIARFPDRAVMDLENETARIVANDAGKRANGGTSLHIVGSGGGLSGFIKDAHTTIQFAGGAVAITTHD